MPKTKIEDKSTEELVKNRNSLKNILKVIGVLVLLLIIATAYFLFTSGWSTDKVPLITSFAVFAAIFPGILGNIKKIEAELAKRGKA